MRTLDLQLNGYKGVDFNADDLSATALRRACEAVRQDGGDRMLVTVISDRLDRMAAVTDATAAGGMSAGRFMLAGQEVLVGDDGAAWAPERSHLVGSTASMRRVCQVLREQVGLSDDDVHIVTAVNPVKALARATSAPGT